MHKKHPLTAPLRNRRTKIVATLGPASSSAEAIEHLFTAGVDVFRLNFSHGTPKDHAERVAIIRDLETKLHHPICIIADLQGPKLRIGQFNGGAINVWSGMPFRLDLDSAPGDQTRVQLPHPELIQASKKGTRLLIDDGRVALEVTKTGKDFLETVVLAGQTLSNNKGVNLPDVLLPIPALTEKDLADMEVALSLNVDYIAQSFVQSASDVIEAKRLIAGRAGLVAKIEKPSALKYISQIIAEADGVMVARGDLGVEIPPEQVPPVQKHLVKLLRRAGKPVIVATQMLESMVSAPVPTRAEVSDVATAIYDGTDAVMLSAETASGKYPMEAVQMMDRIAREIERDGSYRPIMDADHPHTTPDDPADAVSASAFFMATDLHAKAIVTFTTSGSTALRAARQRPAVPTLCLTESERVARRLVLSYGVHPAVTKDVQDFDDMVTKASKIAVSEMLAQKGDRLVITAGVPFGTPGSTNIIRVATIG